MSSGRIESAPLPVAPDALPPRAPGLSLAARLTLWYSGLFTLGVLAASLLVYHLIGSSLDRESRADLEEDLVELAGYYQASGAVGLWEEISREVASDGSDRVFFRLLDGRGRRLRGTDMSEWAALPGGALTLAPDATLESAAHRRLNMPGAGYAVHIAQAALDGGHYLQIGQSLEDHEDFLGLLRQVFWFSVPVVVLLAALPGWYLARKALGGLGEITHTARAIAGGRFKQRVPTGVHGAEIDRLAAAFNQMLDTIEQLIRGMHEITDNIAHDLRSPLTRIRGEVESVLTRAQPATPQEYETVLASTIEESDRLIHMVNTMLDITETEAGLMPHQQDAIDLSRLVQDAGELFLPLAHSRAIDLSWHVEAGLCVKGNAAFLQRLIANLIDNALKYTPAGGRVCLRLSGGETSSRLEVHDSGPGIAETDRERIFSRFYRCDSSRSHAGNGLGLCLARAVARAHGGDIGVSGGGAGGSVFTLTLPRAT